MTQKRFNNLKVGQRIRFNKVAGESPYTIIKVISKGHYKLSNGGGALIADNWNLVPTRKPRKKKGK